MVAATYVCNLLRLRDKYHVSTVIVDINTEIQRMSSS